MKRWRVTASCAVVLALLLFVFLIPVPVGRIRAVGVVESQADAMTGVYVRHKGLLEELNYRPGDRVQKGDVLAVFRDPDTEAERETARVERDNYQVHLRLLEQELRKAQEGQAKSKIIQEQAKTESKRAEADDKVVTLTRILEEEMVLRAPQDGVIGIGPRKDEIGKFFEKDNKPLFTIHAAGHLRVALPLATAEYNRLRDDLERLSDKARRTSRQLTRKVSVKYQNQPLHEVLDDLQSKVKGVTFWVDPKAGADPKTPVTFEAERRPVVLLLDELFGKYSLGYIILSEEGNDHDGWIQVKAGRERGEPDEGRPFHPLDVTVRVHGRDWHTWKGSITSLPQSEARTIPTLLSNKGGGPVAVKAQPGTGEKSKEAMRTGNEPLVPQAQQFIVYVNILRPDSAIVPGTSAQVKVQCSPETCAHWAWRTLHDLFDLGLW